MRSLRRVRSAPLLCVGLAAAYMGLAWALATPVLIAVRAAMQNHAWPYPDRLIPALVELLGLHPSVAAAITVAEVAAIIFGGALSLSLGGGILARLAGPLRAPDFARAAVLHLPALAAIAVYGVLLRVLLLLAIHPLVGAHPRLELLLVAPVLAIATCIGDVAAARRVVRGDRGLHPREYIQACRDTLRSPKLWLGSGALSLARWAIAVTIVLVALHGIGTSWQVWAARGLAAVSVALSLWRMALAVEFTAPARD